MADLIIAQWPRNGRDTIIVKLTEYQGRQIVDCRCWYSATDGELRPGRQGLTLGIAHLPALADAINKALMAVSAPLPEGWDSPDTGGVGGQG